MPGQSNSEYQEEQREADAPRDQSPPAAFSFPGSGILRRIFRNAPPRFDPVRSRLIYMPRARVVRWSGSLTGHVTEDCSFPHCRTDEEGMGNHSETRDDGFDWEGAYFRDLDEAMRNEGFKAWFEDGGMEIMARGEAVIRPPLYGTPSHPKPPLPRFNFVIAEHLHEMRPQEIVDYYAKGDIPVRLRRRGRAKDKKSTLSISDEG